jgi:hypothetical protein
MPPHIHRLAPAEIANNLQQSFQTSGSAPGNRGSALPATPLVWVATPTLRRNVIAETKL